MTVEEFKHIPLCKVAHLNAGDKTYTTYESKAINPKISMCVHSVRNDNFEWIVEAVHYMVNGEVYDSPLVFFKAIEHIEFKPIYEKK